MIALDAPMPERCSLCPCYEYVVRLGHYCKAMAAMGKGVMYLEYDTGYQYHRPEFCPLKELKEQGEQ